MKKNTIALLVAVMSALTFNSTVFAYKFQTPVTESRKAQIDEAISVYAKAWSNDPDFEISNGKTKTNNKHELIIQYLEFPDHKRVLDVAQLKNFDAYMKQVIVDEIPDYKVITGKAALDINYNEERQVYEALGGNNGGERYMKYFNELRKKFKTKDLTPYYYCNTGIHTALILTDGKTSYVRPNVWADEDGNLLPIEDNPILTGDEWFKTIKKKWAEAPEYSEEDIISGNVPAGGGVEKIAGWVYPKQTNDYMNMYIILGISIVALIAGGVSFYFIRKRKNNVQ